MNSPELITALSTHALSQGEKVALRGSARASLTYASLDRLVGALAEQLRQTGCRRIALDAGNGIPWAVADLAALAAGVALVPIPGFFSDRQIAHVFEEAGIELVLCDANAQESWSQRPGWHREEKVNALRELAAFRLDAPHRSHVLNEFVGKITFTSGSTGTPRGVMLSAANIAETSRAIVTALAPLAPQQHLAVLPLATLLENVAGLYAPLLNGSEACLPGDQEIGLSGAALDIECFRTLLQHSEADTLILVPQLLTAVVTLMELGMLTLPSCRFIAVGGGRISSALLARASALQLPVCEGYGLSECCSVLTLNLPGASRRGSVGRPLAHARLRIAEDGEIEVRAPVMEGYLGEAVGKCQWYRTGDIGHLDEDGYLYIDGRRRNVFITAYGRNVNPEWPEAALTAHPAIAQALVCGEAQDHNLALLWPRFAQDSDELQGIVDAANAELPEYARIHAWIAMDAPLPDSLQTPNGRLRRSAVLEAYSALIDDHYLPFASKSVNTRNQHAIS